MEFGDLSGFHLEIRLNFVKLPTAEASPVKFLGRPRKRVDFEFQVISTSSFDF